MATKSTEKQAKGSTKGKAAEGKAPATKGKAAAAAPEAPATKGKGKGKGKAAAAAPAGEATPKVRGPQVSIDSLKVTEEGKRPRYNFEGKVKILVPENPKRGKAGERFAIYKNGMDVAKAFELGVTRSDVKRDLEYGFIELTK